MDRSHQSPLKYMLTNENSTITADSEYESYNNKCFFYNSFLVHFRFLEINYNDWIGYIF